MSGSPYAGAYGFFLIREGRLDEAKEWVSSAVEMAGGTTEWITPVFDAFRDPAKIPAALAAMDQASIDGRVAPRIEISIRMFLGDVVGVMAVARLLEQPGEAFEMDLLFVPEFLRLRQQPEFLDLMANLGITSYWEETGCLWAAAAVHCPKMVSPEP
jgi:hypothetical protein